MILLRFSSDDCCYFYCGLCLTVEEKVLVEVAQRVFATLANRGEVPVFDEDSRNCWLSFPGVFFLGSVSGSGSDIKPPFK